MREELLRYLAEVKGEAPIVIAHNVGVVYLQFSGFSINLYDDRTWIVEDTTGG